MNGTSWSRHGWVLLVVAIGAFCLRAELSGILGIASAAPQPDAQNVAARPVAVGVFHMDQVEKGFKALQSDLGSVEQRRQAFHEEYARDAKALNEVLEQFKMQTEGSEAQVQLKLKWNQMDLALNTKSDLRKAELARQCIEILSNRTAEIQRAAAHIAKQRKLSIVLRKRDTKPVDDGDFLQTREREVVYFNEEVDISAAILEILNKS